MWAARGFRCFPLQQNSKEPIGIAWTVHATKDPATIRHLWTDPVLSVEHDYNVGFCTTGWVVVDVDVKRGKKGLQTFAALGLEFDTLTVRTPSGGYHLYYRGLDREVGQSPLGLDVDIRSHHGYVVAAGSTIDGVGYVVELDLPVAEFPAHLRDRLKAPRKRAEPVVHDGELDCSENIQCAMHWLRCDATPAIEGQNGDAVSYRTACRIRDFGLSEDAALDAFMDAYNPRCSPPWSVEEAAAKVANAYRYATGTPGAASPSSDFGGAVIPFMRSNELPSDSNGGPLLLLHEDGAAQRFAEVHTERLRYCHGRGAWFEWTGSNWKQNGTRVAFNHARVLVRDLVREEDNKVKIAGGRAAFAAAVERFAQSDPRLAVTAEHWDADPWVLGTPGGTVNLKTGLLRQASPHDAITRVTATAPADPHCPLWRRFLAEATGGDADLMRFLQQWAGYTLTGSTREHALVFLFGAGGNGKSVFLNVLSGVMGDYATTAAMDTFVASTGTKHTTDLAALCGARLVVASETERNHAWAESRIKALTGGDPITARFMRQDNFTYRPTFKLAISGNHRPTLNTVDAAAKRRLNLVPFTRTPAKPDRDLEEKLKAEWPGILRWMIEGCLDWQQNGLVRPASVSVATESYFKEQDRFGQWLAETCEVEPGNDRKTATSADLFSSWSRYCALTKDEPGSRQDFAASMKERGIIPSAGAKGVRMYSGVTFRR